MNNQGALASEGEQEGNMREPEHRRQWNLKSPEDYSGPETWENVVAEVMADLDLCPTEEGLTPGECRRRILHRLNYLKGVLREALQDQEELREIRK